MERIDSTIDNSTGLFMQDETGANSVVENYYVFYTLASKLSVNTFSNNDSSNLKKLAFRCSYLNGDIVFNARTLYRTVFRDDTTIFTDTCIEDTTGYAHRRTSKMKSTENVVLFPNPNDGSFTVLASNVGNSTYTISIKDILGRTVFEKEQPSVNGRTFVETKNLESGVYYVSIRLTSGKIEHFKIIKE